jgi:hypothetical protein
MKLRATRNEDGFFEGLIAFIGAVWSALKAIIQGTWDIIQRGWTWAVGLIVIIVGCVTQVVNAFSELLENVASSVAGLTAPNHAPDFSALSEFLAVANHFFPVAEMFGLLTVLSITWLIMISYRLVKSWLPTLS